MKMRKLNRMMIPQGYLRKAHDLNINRLGKALGKLMQFLITFAERAFFTICGKNHKIKLRMHYCVLTFVKKYSTFFQVNDGVIPGLINSCSYKSTSLNNITHIYFHILVFVFQVMLQPNLFHCNHEILVPILSRFTLRCFSRC